MSIIPFQFESKEVRAITHEDGSAWFVAKDVCDVLGIANSRDAIRDLDEDERNTVAINDGNRGNPNLSIISESGFYKLTFRSNKPEAKRLTKWVTSEVLPSIRKTGTYTMPQGPVSHLRSMTDAFELGLKLAYLAGFEGNQARLSADKAVVQVMGESALALVGATHMVAESQDRHLTPTEIGAKIGLGPVKTNRLIAAKGFQTLEGKHWTPTEKGKPYAVLLNTGKKHHNGVAVQQVKWLESIVRILEGQE